MIDRTTGLLITATGVLLVAALLMLGVDLRRAAQTGPRWRRRLVAAGLALLAALGVAGCDDRPQTLCYAPRPLSVREASAARLQQRAGQLRDAVAAGTIGADSAALATANIGAELDSFVAAASDTERADARLQLATIAGFLDEVRALQVIDGRSPLAADGRWQQLAALMAEARLCGSGKLGPFPFDRATQERLQRDLVAGEETLDALAGSGLLNAAEQGLLAQELQYLYRQVSDKRPIEMQLATCYEPMLYLPGCDALARLTARIDTLEQAAVAQTLHPEALRAALTTIETDCLLLTDPAGRGTMTADEQQQAAALTARVQRALAQLTAR
ncbi:MAG TPA: hypothetical protein PKM88_04325 [bacterium]|nr:hypothetical protein [bacterium]